jgi:NAD(P)-dependent dehydrogenase (short-subunit alcohol dehydrogenase family)
MTRAPVPRMPSGGAIINTASVWSRSREAGVSDHVASKRATPLAEEDLGQGAGPEVERQCRLSGIGPHGGLEAVLDPAGGTEWTDGGHRAGGGAQGADLSCSPTI